jgi:DNA-binding CsgD family transcriptional regulator
MLTAAQVAQRLGLDERTVYALAAPANWSASAPQ